MRIPRISKKLLFKSPIAQIYIIDGSPLKRLDVDFHGGGHRLVPYRFIPKDEIWVERGLGADGWFTLLHELSEYVVMKGLGWSYRKGHRMANRIELDARRSRRPKDLATYRILLKHLPVEACRAIPYIIRAVDHWPHFPKAMNNPSYPFESMKRVKEHAGEKHLAEAWERENERRVAARGRYLDREKASAKTDRFVRVM